MSVDPPAAEQVLTPEDVIRLQRVADTTFVHHSVMSYLVNLTVATRSPDRYGMAHLSDVIELGVSPRASLGMLAAGRALALLRGRSYVLPGDVAEIASDVMSHRLLLSFDAVADGADPRRIVQEILTKVPQPSLASREERPLGPPPSVPPSAPPALTPNPPTAPPPPPAPEAGPPEDEPDRASLGEPTRP